MTTNDLQAGESVEGNFFLRKTFHWGVKTFHWGAFISKLIGGFFCMEEPMISSCQAEEKV